MNKKKILIISKVFYPAITPRSFRATELAKEFARQGHEVTVCFPANGYDYSSFEKDNNLRINSLGKLKWKEIILEGGNMTLLFRRVLRRGLQLLFEYPDLELMFKVSGMLKKVRGYDVLISIAVPHSIHWGVARTWYKKLNIAKTWIADCGDPFMGDQMDSFRKLFYFKYIEKWFCRKADYITVPVESAKDAYYPEFRKKIMVIPQGFCQKKLTFKEYHKKVPYPIFAYAGSFIPGKRDPRPFLEFLTTLETNFKFIIYTGHFDLIMPFIGRFGDKLNINDLIPREELLKILSEVDFLVNFDNNKSTQLPSKLIDYAIIGRPVLNIKGPPDFIILDEFLVGDYSHKMNIEELDYYDIESVAEKFLSLT